MGFLPGNRVFSNPISETKMELLIERITSTGSGGATQAIGRIQALNRVRRTVAGIKMLQVENIKQAARATVPAVAPVIAPPPAKIKKPRELAPIVKPPVARAVPSFELLTGGKGIVTPKTYPDDPIDAIATTPEVKPVSLWGDIGSQLGRSVTAAVSTRINTAINPAPIVAPVAAAAGRVLPAIGRVMGSRTVAAASAGAAAATLFSGGGNGGSCPVGYHPNKQNGVRGAKGTYCVRNRRMNFGNSRAARRSVRRLKGARKLLQDIERMMPRRTVRSRAAHHHHPAAGG